MLGHLFPSDVRAKNKTTGWPYKEQLFPTYVKSLLVTKLVPLWNGITHALSKFQISITRLIFQFNSFSRFPSPIGINKGNPLQINHF